MLSITCCKIVQNLFFSAVLLNFLINYGHGAHHPLSNFVESYTYDLEDANRGPLSWGGQCLNGLKQSPVDISFRSNGEEGGVVWGGYTKFQFNSAYNEGQNTFFFANRGHTFQVQFNGKLEEPNSRAGFSGGGLEGHYTFAQMHFHWGQSDEVGSEHTLEGKRYPMEIHMVHYKSRYHNLSHALEENVQDDEAVAVFAILCELGSENVALAPIVEAARLRSVRHVGEIKRSDNGLNLRELLPPDEELDFIRYMGSLTTPPCTEKVAWTVFLCAIEISRAQLHAFRRLRSDEGEEYGNYRPLQNLNGRPLIYFKVSQDDDDEWQEIR